MITILFLLVLFAVEFALELAIVSACYGIICWAFGLVFSFPIAVAITFFITTCRVLLGSHKRIR